MKHFYNNFGCRGLAANGGDLPCPKCIKACRPKLQPMLTDHSEACGTGEVLVADSVSTPSDITGDSTQSLVSGDHNQGDALLLACNPASAITSSVSSALSSSDSLGFFQPSVTNIAPTIHPRMDREC